MTHIQRCPACSDYESQYKTNNPAVHTLGWSGHGLVIPCEDLGWEAVCGLRIEYLFINVTHVQRCPACSDYESQYKTNNPAVHTLGWSGHGLVIPCEDLGWEAVCGLTIEYLFINVTHVQRCPACSDYESQYKTNNPAVHTLGWSGHGLVIPCEDLGWEAVCGLTIEYLFINVTHVQRCPACSDYESQYKTNNPAVHTLGWSGHGLVIPCEDLGWEAVCGLTIEYLFINVTHVQRCPACSDYESQYKTNNPAVHTLIGVVRSWASDTMRGPGVGGCVWALDNPAVHTLG